jgi:hypothetical protein
VGGRGSTFVAYVLVFTGTGYLLAGCTGSSLEVTGDDDWQER